MTNLKPALLAAAAILAATMASASAMPVDKAATALAEGLVQNARMVCDQHGRCYNDRRRAYRYQRQNEYAPYAYAPRYQQPYYQQPYQGYYGGPRVGVGIGPLGLGVW